MSRGSICQQKGIATISAVLLILTSCSSSSVENAVGTVSLKNVPFSEVPFDAAWLSDSHLLIAARGEEYDTEIWLLELQNFQHEILHIPEPNSAQCLRTVVYNPQLLDTGEVAFLQDEVSCEFDGPIRSHTRSILIWDPATGEFTIDPNFPIQDSNIVNFSLTLDGTRGIGSTNSGISDELYWLDETGSQAVDLGMDRASNPQWSPYGQVIAFFGSKNLRGPEGPVWATQPDGLWIVPADCEPNCPETAEQLIADIREATDLGWSPNGDWLAFTGDPFSRGQGVWLINVKTGNLTWIASGDFTRLAWAPTGDRLVVISRIPENPSQDHAGVYILDVSEIISK